MRHDEKFISIPVNYRLYNLVYKMLENGISRDMIANVLGISLADLNWYISQEHELEVVEYETAEIMANSDKNKLK